MKGLILSLTVAFSVVSFASDNGNGNESTQPTRLETGKVVGMRADHSAYSIDLDLYAEDGAYLGRTQPGVSQYCKGIAPEGQKSRHLAIAKALMDSGIEASVLMVRTSGVPSFNCLIDIQAFSNH